MAKQTRAQLIALLNSKILTGGNRTKAQDIRDFENAIIESVVNILDGENLPDGYMGIDPAGFADPSFIKAPSPIGYFLKDDGTWDAAGVQSVTGPQVDNTDPANPIVSTPTLTETVAEDTTANNLLALKNVNENATSTAYTNTQFINYFVQGSGTLLKGTIAALRAFFQVTYDTIYAKIASPTFTGTVTTPAIIVSSETANRVAIIDASKNVKSSSTTTTQLGYLDATSSIQTQLDGKLSATKERLLYKSDIATINPADATTYYFGDFVIAPVLNQGRARFQFDGNFTLTKIVFSIRTTVVGSNEAVAFYLQESGTTDYPIVTDFDFSVLSGAIPQTFNYSMPMSVTAGTYYEFKMVTPNFTTNPTGFLISVKVYGY